MDHSDIVQAQVVDPNIRGVSIDGNGSGLRPSTSYVCVVMAATVEGNGAAASITKETGSSETATLHSLSRFFAGMLDTNTVNVVYSVIYKPFCLVSAVFL